MRWKRGHQSVNVEDHRRGRGGGRIPLPRRGLPQLGCGGIILLLILSFVFKIDPMQLLDAAGGGGASSSVGTTPVPPSSPGVDPDGELKSFVSFQLDDMQEVWSRLLPRYRPARLVLFDQPISSACGYAQSAMGPFYCPGDEKVYIDLGFYRELSQRFGAPGDFAQAYVLAHEIGHHIQKVLGIEGQVRSAQRANPGLSNQYSVRMELQADCLAGVWGKTTARRDLLDPGDVEEGLRAAAAIGDDRIQQMSGRYVSPESFTHGSSQQRMEWFRRGFDSGDPDVCDTFSG